MIQKNMKDKMKQILIEIYICFIEFNSFNLKKSTNNLANIVSKVDNFDFSKEAVKLTINLQKFDENEISLIKKLLCNQILVMFNSLFKDEEIFIEFKRLLEDVKQLLKILVIKDFFKWFILLIVTCVFLKKGVKKLADFYLSQLKTGIDKYQINQCEINIIPSLTINKTQSDEFSNIIGKLLKLFNSEFTEKNKITAFVRVDSTLNVNKNLGKSINESPRRNSSLNLSSVKQVSNNKVSDYHKYIRNVIYFLFQTNNIKNISIHSPKSRKSSSFIKTAKQTKNSFNLKQNDNKVKKIIEDDNLSNGPKQYTKSTFANEISINHQSKSNQPNKDTITCNDVRKIKNDNPIDKMITNINNQLKIFEKCIYEYSENLLSSRKSFRDLNH